MWKAQVKIWLVSIGGAVVSLVLFVYGIRLLISPNDPSSAELYILAFGSMFCGIFTIASPAYIPRKFMLGGVLMLLGFYFFGRADGFIERAWIIRSLGLGSLIGSGVMVYVTYLAGKKIHY